jgi:hypothetical protein
MNPEPKTQTTPSDAVRLGLPSASSFYRLVDCPGSANLIRSLSDQIVEPPDPDAIRGTKIHKALETNNSLELDEEEAETFRNARKFEQAILYQWITDNNLPEDKLQGPIQEQRLWLNSEETMEPILSGQLDAYWTCGEHALCIERKAGFATWVPPSYRSWQGRTQVTLLWREYDGLQKIRFATCKPKVKTEPTDFVDYTVADLERSLQAILYHLWLAGLPDAPRRGGSQCRYCSARAFCKEAAAYSLLPSVINTNGDLLAAVQQLSGPDLVKLWETEAVVNKIYEAVKTRLKAMPDWQLGELGLERGKPRRLDVIRDTQWAWDFLVSTGAEPKDLWPALKFSKTELAAALRATRGFSKEGAAQYIREALAPAIEQKESEAPLKKKAV